MAQAGVAASPLLHDNSLAAALGGRLSPSPWSRFLSPSLFSQRSSTPTQTLPPPPAAAAATAGGSPLKESTTSTHHQPGQFTHAREINPFERSFAVVDGPAAIPPGGADGGSAALPPPPPTTAAGVVGATRLKRKRALSSPALFTPGGSAQPDFLAPPSEVDDDMRAFFQAKRPGLRCGPADLDSGIGFIATTDAAAGPAVDMVPSESTYSLRSRGSSGHNSFDSTTGSSLLGRRRALSATDSPDTSVAPSPPSPKLGSGGVDASQFGQAGSSTFTHFQPQPLAFTMPPATASMPYGDPAVLAMTTLAPSSIAPHAVVPLPFASASEPQSFEPVTMPLDPMTSFAPFPPASQAFAPVPPSSMAAPLPHGIPHPVPLHSTAPGAFAAAPPPIPLAQQHLPPIPASTHAPPSLPLGAPAFAPPAPAAFPPAPTPAAATAAKASKKASPVAGPSKPLGPAPPLVGEVAAPASAADADEDAAPAAPTRPPGKKRGRKPKNWDPTLESTVELDPEEQERQRKLALERNRIAASKSRRRKKERVELLETASTDLCTRNLALQAECRNLFTEVHALRTMLAQAHPEHSCQCPHIVGYVVRERDGGGIPAILYGASGTIDRDYTRPPRWGTDDDVFAGAVETQALHAIAGGGHSLVNLVGGRAGASYPRATSSIRSDTPGPASAYYHQQQPQGQHPQPYPQQAHGVLPPMVGASTSSAAVVRPQIPLKAPNPAAAAAAAAPTGRSSPKKGHHQPLPAQQQPHMTRGASAAAGGGGAALDAGHAELDESDESEEETVTLKSRRARAISTRTKE